MSLTYSGRLRLALQTAHHAREGTWPWGADATSSKLARIHHRQKVAALTEPPELDGAGRVYTDALYNYAKLAVRSHAKQGDPNRWRKIPADFLRKANEVQPAISEYIAANPEKEDTNGR